MLNIFSVIGTILVLSFLVIIHELGHYWAAKKNGVKVHEFGIGFPPKLFSFKKGETEWCINLIPFGGYVRLHGEDATDPKILNDNKSFASKKPWQKLEIILAGVFMNFMVFWILMTVAIISGVDPLVTNQEQFRTAFLDGYYKMKPGVVVENSTVNGVAQGDYLVKVDDKDVKDTQDVLPIINGDYTNLETLTFESADAAKKTNIETKVIDGELDFYPVTLVPIFEVQKKSDTGFLSNYLEVGDKIYSVNDNPVFDLNTFLESFHEPSYVDDKHVIDVIRDNKNLSITVPAYEQLYVVDLVNESSPAKKAGIQVGDTIIAVDGLLVTVKDNLAEIVKNKGLETVVYTVNRNGEEIDLIVNPNKEGLIGVALTSSINLLDFGINFKNSFEVGSVYKIKKYSVPYYIAPFTALKMGYEIAGATVKAFVGTIFNLVTNFKVSEEVGGPVQVAKMGYYFVGKGGTDLLNFIALISLSLAVINILPIPALDGGRFLFIVIEALKGSKLNPKVEAAIHTFGFVALMSLILIISIFDIIRL